MMKRFGSLLWSQSTEVKFLNYPKHLVWEIWTNNGFIYLVKDKQTKKIEYTESATMVDVSEAIMVKKPELK